MEYLKQLDKKIFVLIHHDWSNSFVDAVMPYLRDKYFWIPLYVILICMILYRFKLKSWMVILTCILLITLTDQISSSFFKPYFHRLRPCQNAELAPYIHHIIDCGSGFSFVSSHAANHFALAVFLGIIFYSRMKWLLYALCAWAAVVCYAQVYVAYHYPADVICGALLGIVSAIAASLVVKKFLFKPSLT